MSILRTTALLVLIALVSTPSFSKVNPNFEPLADSFNVSNPNAVQAINIPYGDIDQSKQLFHIFLPNTEDTFPLVIFIHGGGFTGGNPGTVFKDPERRETAKYFLDQGVAFISLGYRLIAEDEPDAEGVIKSLSDAKRGLQFIRHHAQDLHIDPTSIAVMGSSAGAGTSLWLGVRDDMADPDATDPVLRESTRVAAVFASATQATYDLYKWETEIFNDFDGQGTSFTLDSIAEVMTTETVSNFYGGLDSLYQMVNDPVLVQYREDVDMLHHLSNDDPPIYIYSKNSAVHPSDDVLHHWYHSKEVYDVALGANATEVKGDIVEASINTTDGETGNEFLIRHLNVVAPPPGETVLSVQQLAEVQVYPNPASTHFFVSLENDEVQQVEVLSLSGNVVSSQRHPKDAAPIAISFLHEGVYFVRVTGSKTVALKRLVIR